MIKILQITGAMEGGIRRHLVSILKGLDNNEFSTGFVFSDAHQDARFLEELPFLADHCNGIFFPLHIRKKPSLNDFTNILAIIRKIRNRGFDIIHGHGAKGGLYARIVAKAVGAKSIYTPHGGSLHPVYRELMHKIYILTEKILYPLSDKLIFESQFSLNQYISLTSKSSAKKMIVNFNGVPSDVPGIETSTKKGGEGFDIGLFGLLRHLKGQDVMLDALSLLIHSFRSVKVHFFGNGPEKDFLVAKAKSLGLASAVYFHGDVSNAENYMKQCDLIVQPSRHEAFGYSVLEAMSLGKAVVASKVGGLIEIIVDGETGTLVPPDNPHLLAEAVGWYIKDPILLKRHGKAGAERAARYFSEEVMIRNLAAIYKELAR